MNNSEPEFKGRHALVVDDSHASSALLGLLLKKLGFTTELAASGPEALQKLAVGMPDIIFLDVMMPDMDGNQVCRQIRTMPGGDFVPILMVSALSEVNDIANSLDAGADDYISKPAAQGELIARSRALLRTRDLFQKVKEQAAELARINQLLEEQNKKITVYNTRTRKEMDQARRVQSILLPHTPTTVGGVQLFGKYIPSLDVGGDYFDFILLPDDRVRVIIADVSGHGLSAALIVSIIKSFFTSHFTDPQMTIEKLIHKFNSDLVRSQQREYFATVALLEIDLAHRKLRVINSSHPAVFFLHKSGQMRLFESCCTMIGIFDKIQPVLEEVDFEPGDRILLYTDGIPETRNCEGKFYTEERLSALFIQKKDAPAAELAESILADLKFFHGDCPPADDLALLVVDLP